jgi:hypothetical protein
MNEEIKKAGLPIIPWQSGYLFQTRNFPPLSHDRFGFVITLLIQ